MSWVLTGAAVVMAATLLHREFSSPPEAGPPKATHAPVSRQKWNELLAGGHTIGKADAAVKIVEFADFECPYCRRFHERFVKWRATRGDSVALILVHYPLDAHKFARPAAQASECASDQGKFAEFAALVYRKQDSLGLKSLDSYAQEAGVSDTAAFGRCSRAVKIRDVIDRGHEMGRALDVAFTPTILINGVWYGAPPSDAQFEDIFTKARK